MTCCVGTLAGCARVDRRASWQFEPVPHPRPGGVEILVTVNGKQWEEPIAIKSSRFARRSPSATPGIRQSSDTAQKITLVNVTDDTGRTITKRVIPLCSEDLLMYVLNEELSTAGYTVKLVHKLPKDVKNGVDVSWVHPDMEETFGLLTVQGSCDLQLTIDVWRNGTKIGTHNYVSKVSDYSITNQDQLPAQLLWKRCRVSWRSL